VKITEVSTHPLYIPLLERRPLSTVGKLGASHVLLKIFTDSGIVLCASSPYVGFVEVMSLPLSHFFIQPSLRPEAGFLAIPGGPGLGIEIDDDVIKAHLHR
jgi:hypothetical protein